MLSYINQQHAQKGVSEMLLRLYSPFLWRSLKVAHPHVRANAASLLLDAFPLQDPDSTRDQIDVVLQKQFDLMMVSFFCTFSKFLGMLSSGSWEFDPACCVYCTCSTF